MGKLQTPTMISKKTRAATLILSLVAFALCLVVGIQAGSTLHRSPTHPTAAAVDNSVEKNDQRTIILALADNIENPKSELKAIWLVIYRPGVSFVSLTPVYPGASSLLGKAGDNRHFILDDQNNLDPAFTNLLKEEGIVWNGMVLLDQTGLDALLSDLNMNAADKDDGTATQIQNLCNHIPTLLSSPDWGQKFSSLMPQHLHTDLAFETIVTDWQSLKDPGGSLSCEITKPQ